MGRFEVVTDDAYVKADSTTIAPRCSGHIAAVLVSDNEYVKTGQILARIDDRDFKAAREQARADVESAEGQHRHETGGSRCPAIPDRGGQGCRRGRQGKPDVRGAGGRALRAARFQGLRQCPECAAGCLAGCRRPRHRGPRHRDPRERNPAARRAPGRAAQAQAALARADAVLHQAELNLSDTTIVPPIDGVIGNRTLRIGHTCRRARSSWRWCRPRPPTSSRTTRRRSSRMYTPASRLPSRLTRSRATSSRGRVDSLSPASGQEFAAAAAGQRDRQLHQGRPAHPGEDRAQILRAPLAVRAAARHVGLPDHRHQGQRDPHRLSVRTQQLSRAELAQERCHVDHDCPSDAPLSAFHSAPAAPSESASLTDWIAVLASMIGAFMAILNIQITNALSSISRAASAPASTTGPGFQPPTSSARSW